MPAAEYEKEKKVTEEVLKKSLMTADLPSVDFLIRRVYHCGGSFIEDPPVTQEDWKE